jgi:elongation factor 2
MRMLYTGDPALVIPASRQAIQAAMLMAGDNSLSHTRKCSSKYLKTKWVELQRKYRVAAESLWNMRSEGDTTVIESKHL